ncbi:hypothetical protein HUX88_25925 [Duganella sp. BJB1802]|nr:hypothetical protein [Duganella sp. BJB1802]
MRQPSRRASASSSDLREKLAREALCAWTMAGRATQPRHSSVASAAEGGKQQRAAVAVATATSSTPWRRATPCAASPATAAATPPRPPASVLNIRTRPGGHGAASCMAPPYSTREAPK